MLRMRDIMTTEVVSVGPETTLRDAMELLTRHHVSGAPVLAGGRLEGVVSASDLIDFAVSDAEGSDFDDHTVDEIMTRSPVTLGPDESVRKGAELMRRDGIHRIVIVEHGHVLGVVSAMDVARSVADRKIGSPTYVFNKDAKFGA
ncbi:MAG: HPP family protein [Gemmatimonadales bacterium]